MNRIAVYSGSNHGNRNEYKEAALRLGRTLAGQRIELVYGGSQFGLMGEVANAVLSGEGSVIGVMPKGLFPKEAAHPGLQAFYEVEDMHARKKLMAELSDGYIALPGGAGTYEELFEMLSWAQLGIHGKPMGLLNAGGFFDPLIAMLRHTIREGFMKEAHHDLLCVSDDPEGLIAQMARYEPPALGVKWKQLERC
ncbi:LOG family protein [Gorillibacterium timonense]|uniref:LOG family protein n=1 Tax=Gorillibacterium timonense TaxID=1689269 RepID=UPI00071D37FB|nr:TIGR00730 family Rossman fold protein [Gorillibacterium timonense]